ncbi:MAG: hypothetical protein ACNYPE_08325 [Candidatus Azotimanducaceae bacterium WSBS_2022_MAG_OTU7]
MLATLMLATLMLAGCAGETGADLRIFMKEVGAGKLTETIASTAGV